MCALLQLIFSAKVVGTAKLEQRFTPLANSNTHTYSKNHRDKPKEGKHSEAIEAAAAAVCILTDEVKINKDTINNRKWIDKMTHK